MNGGVWRWIEAQCLHRQHLKGLSRVGSSPCRLCWLVCVWEREARLWGWSLHWLWSYWHCMHLAPRPSETAASTAQQEWGHFWHNEAARDGEIEGEREKGSRRADVWRGGEVDLIVQSLPVPPGCKAGAVCCLCGSVGLHLCSLLEHSLLRLSCFLFLKLFSQPRMSELLVPDLCADDFPPLTYCMSSH